jgi:DNA-binding transcriptional LysR family regulator
MSFAQLEYFVAAAELGSMTAASKRLMVAQSAISAAVANLERLLKTDLLLRVPAKGVQLTSTGESVLVLAREILKDASSLLEYGNGTSGTRAPLNIAAFSMLAPFYLPSLISSFSQTNPHMELNTHEGTIRECEARILEARCEVGLLYDIALNEDLAVEPLMEVRPYVLLPSSHPMAGRTSIFLEQLEAEPMILLDSRPSSTYFSRVFAAAQISPTVAHRTINFEMVRTMVGAGYGWSLLNQRPVGDITYEGHKLAVVPIANAVPTVTVALAWRKEARISERCKEFMHYTMVYFGKMRQANIPRGLSRR